MDSLKSDAFDEHGAKRNNACAGAFCRQAGLAVEKLLVIFIELRHPTRRRGLDLQALYFNPFSGGAPKEFWCKLRGQGANNLPY